MEPLKQEAGYLDEYQRAQLQRILVAAFPTKESLRKMVVGYLDPARATAITDAPLADEIYSLILWAGGVKKDEDLVIASLAADPDDEPLRAFAISWAEAQGRVDHVLVAALKKKPSEPLITEMERLLTRLRGYMTAQTKTIAEIGQNHDKERAELGVQLGALQEIHWAQLTAEQHDHHATADEVEKLKKQLDDARQAHRAELVDMRLSYKNQHESELQDQQRESQKAVAALQDSIQRKQHEIDASLVQVKKLKTELQTWKSAVLTFGLGVAALIISVCLTSLYMAFTSGVALPWINSSWDGFASLVLAVVALWAVSYFILERYRMYFVL